MHAYAPIAKLPADNHSTYRFGALLRFWCVLTHFFLRDARILRNNPPGRRYGMSSHHAISAFGAAICPDCLAGAARLAGAGASARAVSSARRSRSIRAVTDVGLR
jgi:hypothetical protein